MGTGTLEDSLSLCPAPKIEGEFMYGTLVIPKGGLRNPPKVI
jgi:hypothetical protein